MKNRKDAFTLSELLIALAILGVIATFTIPKVLQSQQNGVSKAIAKEALGTISGAYDAYKVKNTVTGSFGPHSITPYLNYIQARTTGTIDHQASNLGSQNCTPTDPCYMLANGSAFLFNTDNSFGQTNTTNYIYFYFDPDGVAKNTAVTDGPSKSIVFILYTNGRIATTAERKAGDITYESGTPTDWGNGSAAGVPSWFSWN